MSYLVLLRAILLGQLQYWMLVSIEHTDKYKGQNFQSRTCHPPCTLLTHNMRLKVFKASNTYAYFLHLLPLYLTNNNMRVKKFFGNGTPSCPLLVSIDYFQKVNSNCFVPDFECKAIFGIRTEKLNYPLCVSENQWALHVQAQPSINNNVTWYWLAFPIK